MDQDTLAEQHLLYVLLDSNLPTGGFVASSGLESYAKHGHLSHHSLNQAGNGRPDPLNGLLGFIKESVRNYSLSTLPFVVESWKVLQEVEDESRGLENVCHADQAYNNMTLNHVTQRSSRAQGIAMLTLFSKGLSYPKNIHDSWNEAAEESTDNNDNQDQKVKVIDRYKLRIRRGETAGHLPICWGLITSALGLRIDRAIHLHLFLHVRSILSSAVRLNIIGPYASTQLLLHPARTLVDNEVSRFTSSFSCEPPLRILTTNSDDFSESTEASSAYGQTETIPIPVIEDEDEDDWSWADEKGGEPCTTWPLGEIMMGRHDLQHTRIFNS